MSDANTEHAKLLNLKNYLLGLVASKDPKKDNGIYASWSAAINATTNRAQLDALASTIASSLGQDVKSSYVGQANIVDTWVLSPLGILGPAPVGTGNPLLEDTGEMPPPTLVSGDAKDHPSYKGGYVPPLDPGAGRFGDTADEVPPPANGSVTKEEVEATDQVLGYKEGFDKKQESLRESMQTDETGIIAAEYNQSVKTEKDIDSAVADIKKQKDALTKDDTLTPGEKRQVEADLAAKEQNVKQLGADMANMTAEGQQNVEKFFENVEKDPEGTKKWMVKQQEKIDKINNTPNVSKKVKQKAIAAINSGNNSSPESLIAWFKAEESKEIKEHNDKVAKAANTMGGVSGMVGVAGGGSGGVTTPPSTAKFNDKPNKTSKTQNVNF